MRLYEWQSMSSERLQISKKNNISTKRRKLIYVFFSGLLFIILMLWNYFYHKDIYLDKTIFLKKWENISRVYNELWYLDKSFFKLYIKLNKQDLSNLTPWNYVFTGQYEKQQIIDILKQWPLSEYLSITILEWWSKYDIDAALTRKWYIQPWEYIRFIQDSDIINKYITRYEFLKQASQDSKEVNYSLEWFLYPETYFIDPSKNIIDQLVYLQLEEFNKKIRIPYKDKFLNFNSTLSKQGFDLDINFYELITLASIIQKEDNNPVNQPTIAWIFFNRLENNIQLGADISLCYWLKITYDNCSKFLTTQNLQDTSNSYNTRALWWIPPTPIANPSQDTVNSLLNFENIDYFYYLHDTKWNFYPAKTIQEHNINKSKYLNR